MGTTDRGVRGVVLRRDSHELSRRGALKRYVRLSVAASAAVAMSLGTLATTASASKAAQARHKKSPVAGQLAKWVPAAMKKKGVIVFGSPETNPPQLYLNSSQKLTGIDYQFGQQIALELGLKAEWVNTPFPSLIPGIDAGRIDVVLNSMDDTPVREQQLIFVDYEADGALLLVQKGDPAGITTLASLCGKSISLLSGSYQVNLVQNQQAKCSAEGKPAIQASQYESVGDAILAVQSGRADAFFSSLGGAVFHQYADPSVFEVAPKTEVYAPGPIGAAVAKSDPQLARALVRAFQLMYKDGSYGRILKRFSYSAGGLTQFKIDGGKSFNLNATEPYTG